MKSHVSVFIIGVLSGVLMVLLVNDYINAHIVPDVSIEVPRDPVFVGSEFSIKVRLTANRRDYVYLSSDIGDNIKIVGGSQTTIMRSERNKVMLPVEYQFRAVAKQSESIDGKLDIEFPELKQRISTIIEDNRAELHFQVSLFVMEFLRKDISSESDVSIITITGSEYQSKMGSI